MKIRITLPLYGTRAQKKLLPPRIETYYCKVLNNLWLQVECRTECDCDDPEDARAVEVIERIKSVDQPPTGVEFLGQNWSSDVEYDMAKTKLGETSRQRYLRLAVYECIMYGYKPWEVVVKI
jgi:hypothetical protein